MKKIQCIKCSAMMTVEAAFLIPFFLIVIVYCIFLTFHLYNADITYQSAYLSTLRSSIQTEMTSRERYEMVTDEFSDLIADRLVACEQCSQKVETGFGYVKLEYELQTCFPFAVSYLNQEQFNNTDMIKSYVINPVTLIRSYRTLQGIIDRGKENECVTGDEEGY